MLTNLEEKGRVKCHQYWPDDRVKVPGNIRVATLEQLELAEYTVRTFSLKRVRVVLIILLCCTSTCD